MNLRVPSRLKESVLSYGMALEILSLNLLTSLVLVELGVGILVFTLVRSELILCPPDEYI